MPEFPVAAFAAGDANEPSLFEVGDQLPDFSRHGDSMPIWLAFGEKSRGCPSAGPVKSGEAAGVTCHSSHGGEIKGEVASRR